jgi:hypothetical protein
MEAAPFAWYISSNTFLLKTRLLPLLLTRPWPRNLLDSTCDRWMRSFPDRRTTETRTRWEYSSAGTTSTPAASRSGCRRRTRAQCAKRPRPSREGHARGGGASDCCARSDSFLGSGQDVYAVYSFFFPVLLARAAV